MTGRNLYRSLHTVIGAWVLVFYLLSAMTGLWWSFGERTSWYRQAASLTLTGRQYNNPDGDGGFPLPRDFGPAWRTFEATNSGSYQWVAVEVRDRNAPVRFRTLQLGAPHDRAWNTVKVDSATGRLLSRGFYGQRNGAPVTLGESILANVIPIHTGTYFGLPGRLALALASGTMPLFAVTGWPLYLGRRRAKRVRQKETPAFVPVGGDGSLLVVYASQTGNAEFLARQTAAAFASAGRMPNLVALARLDSATLSAARAALFIASAHGEGEPPDGVRSFARKHMSAPLDLSGLGRGILALGDREYPDFCAFGRRLDDWLGDSGALRLFDTIAANAMDDDALAAWRQATSAMGAASDLPARKAIAYDLWRLTERTLLNPGSRGLPVFHVAIKPIGPCVDWTSGDIAEIIPQRLVEEQLGAVIEEISGSTELPSPVDPRQVASVAAGDAVTRDYSIAFLPHTKRIELIVRQTRSEQGALGLGSGWLTSRAAIGESFRLRIKRNAAFHPFPDEHSAILIGNGTGIAGLLAHLRLRAAAGKTGSWLLLGERSLAHDRFHAAELDRLLETDALERIDYAFSRDPNDGHYVQDLLLSQAERLRAWVEAGAVVYVCGSVSGMAPAVDANLRLALGDDRVDELIDASRYRRDVY